MESHLVDVDLSDAEGLEAIVHRGLSTVGIDTIYKSRGKIPGILRGCGVSEGLIAYIGSMVGGPSSTTRASSAGLRLFILQNARGRAR